jgi:hypothetical protein
MDEAMRRADREVRGRIEQRAHEAWRRAEQVVRRIEKGDVSPRPLPGLRDDSMPSMESMTSMESSPSMKSTESADYASRIPEGTPSEGEMMTNMPLDGAMPYNPATAHENLAQELTEETGSEGDLHAHAEKKADEIAHQMTEDTGAGGDMEVHAERKVQKMGQEMFEE